jgi:hypothetical protein
LWFGGINGKSGGITPKVGGINRIVGGILLKVSGKNQKTRGNVRLVLKNKIAFLWMNPKTRVK